MSDRFAVIWTRTGAGPVKMGSLVYTGTETRFSYEPDFVATGGHGISIALSPALFGSQPFVHRSDSLFPLPPRLMAYVPGHGADNLQRRLYTDMLRLRPPATPEPPRTPFDEDWEILMLTGRDGIGHLDLFRDDRDALAHYAGAPRTQPESLGARSSLWHYFTHGLDRDFNPDEIRHIADALGPTPSAEGMIPKLLVSIPDAPVWDGRFTTPGVGAMENHPYRDVLLKITPRDYPGVTYLEALCYDVHRELGFRTPRYWLGDFDGLNTLAVERFDRVNGLPIPMESIFSVFAMARFISRQSDLSMEELGRNLIRLGRVGIAQAPARAEVFRRFLAALYTGNGDLHLRNLSFLGSGAHALISPVYDPAPMRAWDRHNLLSALPFDPVHRAGLRAAVAHLGVLSFGLSAATADQLIHEIERGTQDYAERVESLILVPAATRQRLADRVRQLRAKMTTGAAGDSMPGRSTQGDSTPGDK